MYMKLITLISQVLFYELDMGADINVAIQQHTLTFSPYKEKQENLSIADQFRKLSDRSVFHGGSHGCMAVLL
jgi:hypothetical protein